VKKGGGRGRADLHGKGERNPEVFAGRMAIPPRAFSGTREGPMLGEGKKKQPLGGGRKEYKKNISLFITISEKEKAHAALQKKEPLAHRRKNLPGHEIQPKGKGKRRAGNLIAVGELPFKPGLRKDISPGSGEGGNKSPPS